MSTSNKVIVLVIIVLSFIFGRFTAKVSDTDVIDQIKSKGKICGTVYIDPGPVQKCYGLIEQEVIQ